MVYVVWQFFLALVLIMGIFLHSQSEMSEFGVVGQVWEDLASNDIQHHSIRLQSNFNIL